MPSLSFAIKAKDLLPLVEPTAILKAVALFTSPSPSFVQESIASALKPAQSLEFVP